MTTTPENLLLNNYKKPSNVFESSNSQNKLIKKIFKLFNKKYSKMPSHYNHNIIDNIIYNEKSHIVAKFKDRLIIDDTGEFLKRYYKKNESLTRLPKFFEYYDLYSKIFPNYTIFYEGKYLYQNIQKKQRMIDLQKKLEMKEKKKIKEGDKKEEGEEYKEKVFNTDEIDSILNGTNNEGMEILFNVNKNNIKKDEEIFNKEINDIIDKIAVFENSNKYYVKEKNNHNNSNKKNKIKNHNNHNNILNNNIDSNKDNTWNKKINVPINLNYSKNKRLRNSSLMSTINNTNITYYNNIQSIISKFFNVSTRQKNSNNKNNSKVKYYPKKDKKLIEKMEQNLFKMKKMSIGFQKNLSQNISTSNQTQKEIKDISMSKKNSSIYTKKPSSSNSSARNQKTNIKRNIKSSSSSTYKISNTNLINSIVKKQNVDTRKKREKSPLTSRNPPLNKIGFNLYKTKMKSIKGNTYYVSDITSRNKKSNNFSINKKEKSSICSSSSKARDIKNSNSKNKKNYNNNNNRYKYPEQYTKKIGYKEISYIRNGIKNNLREKLLYNGVNINNNNSRNRTMMKNMNKSQPKTIINQSSKNVSRNDSTLKLGVLDIINNRKNQAKNNNFNNFSKILNVSNNYSKNLFSKTHKNNFGLHK